MASAPAVANSRFICFLFSYFIAVSAAANRQLAANRSIHRCAQPFKLRVGFTRRRVGLALSEQELGGTERIAECSSQRSCAQPRCVLHAKSDRDSNSCRTPVLKQIGQVFQRHVGQFAVRAGSGVRQGPKPAGRSGGTLHNLPKGFRASAPRKEPLWHKNHYPCVRSKKSSD